MVFTQYWWQLFQVYCRSGEFDFFPSHSTVLTFVWSKKKKVCLKLIFIVKKLKASTWNMSIYIDIFQV